MEKAVRDSNGFWLVHVFKTLVQDDVGSECREKEAKQREKANDELTYDSWSGIRRVPKSAPFGGLPCARGGLNMRVGLVQEI